jgi:hypothetical protein
MRAADAPVLLFLYLFPGVFVLLREFHAGLE